MSTPMRFPEPRFPGVPRQGTVYEWPGPGRYVVVVSNDDVNDGSDPQCVPVVRTAPVSTYVVPLADADPIGGRLVVTELSPILSTEISREKGMVTGDTWQRLANALDLMFSADR